MTDRFSQHRPQDGADTGGVPWAGRTLTGTGFDGDTGEADAVLAGLLGAEDRDPADVVDAVARARLVVPIVAVAAEVDDSSGTPVDARSDMASVTLVAPDGQRALPAFTSTHALAAWDPAARPVPVTAQRAARAALQEGCEVVTLDLPPSPGPAAWTLSGSMVRALAAGRGWAPAHRDEHVVAAVAEVVAREEAVGGHDLGGEAGELVVALSLRPGLTRAELEGVVGRISRGIALDTGARERIDAVAFRLGTA
ncbi:SseB family protein [Serinicoccus chungangensis]|uniref:SseB family protein n=1 Tax=Serinicoccus chungangensis TaxID=767452 RepID=UPI00111912D9|nr:SseB family protein [Serinicoccus chungangensis]